MGRWQPCLGLATPPPSLSLEHSLLLSLSSAALSFLLSLLSYVTHTYFFLTHFVHLFTLSLSLSLHHTSKLSLTSRANVSQVLKTIRVFNPFSLNYYDSSFFFFYFERSLKMKKARTKTKRNKWGQFIICVAAHTNQPDSFFSLKTKPNFIQVSGFLFRKK